MSQDATVQSDEDFHKDVMQELESVEETGIEDDAENIFDTPVEAASQDGAQEQEAAPSTEQLESQETSIDDFLAKIEGVDLSKAPKGSAIPMERFRQVLSQRNETRSELEQLRQKVAELETQAHKPAWMDELASTLKPQEQAPQSEDEWINSILGEPTQQSGGVDPNQVAQLLDSHPTVQRFNTFLQQQEQAAQQFQQAQALRQQVQEIKEVFPDVDEQLLLNVYVNGGDMLQTAQRLMEWRGQGSQAARQTPAAEAPPSIGRGPSRPAKPQSDEGEKDMDDDAFLMHMKQLVTNTFGK